MSDTRYPTRMHEVLGVEAGQLFSIYDFADDEFFLNIHGRVMLKVPSGACPASGEIISHAINHGITRRPRLSEEQVKKLHAALLLGFKWLTVNSVDELWLFGTKPRKFSIGWGESEQTVARLTLGNHLGLSSLVSWSDPEPLDIVATLKAAGVEVEK